METRRRDGACARRKAACAQQVQRESGAKKTFAPAARLFVTHALTIMTDRRDPDNARGKLDTFSRRYAARACFHACAISSNSSATWRNGAPEWPMLASTTRRRAPA